jgi:hypothetical protein
VPASRAAFASRLREGAGDAGAGAGAAGALLVKVAHPDDICALRQAGGACLFGRPVVVEEVVMPPPPASLGEGGGGDGGGGGGGGSGGGGGGGGGGRRSDGRVWLLHGAPANPPAALR